MSVDERSMSVLTMRSSALTKRTAGALSVPGDPFTTRPQEAEMYVQIIEFETRGITREEYEAFCQEAVPAIAQIPGVVSKLFLADAETSRRAGIYTFTDRARAEAYLSSELFQTAMARNPAIANVRTRGAELIEAPTRALGGIPALAAA